MKRIQYIDIAKGMAICLMVLGHSSIPAFLSNFIWSFHMPLFFIASGWTTNWEKGSFGGFLGKKARGLLVPFCVYSVIVLALETVTGMNTFRHVLVNGWEGYALWFVPVLFFALVLMKGISLVSSKKLQAVLVGGGNFDRLRSEL